MVRIISALLIAMSWSGVVWADESTEVSEPPEIVLDAPPANKEANQQQPTLELETITIYESKFFPGFRPCTPEDYRNQDRDPVACQDQDAARIMSTREEVPPTRNLIVDDDVVPQGNIYKLRFERFKREKQ